MILNKTFLKKTRKGGILKIVREHYLREDIDCGLEWCSKCVHDPGKTGLSPVPSLTSSLCRFQHYLVPDTNVVLHQVMIRHLV